MMRGAFAQSQAPLTPDGAGLLLDEMFLSGSLRAVPGDECFEERYSSPSSHGKTVYGNSTPCRSALKRAISYLAPGGSGGAFRYPPQCYALQDGI